MSTTVPAGLRLRRPDPTDTADVDALHALRTAVAEAGPPYHPRPCRADLAGSLRVPPPATATEEWTAHEGQLLVGSLRLEFPTEENTDTALAAVLEVHPAARRRGIGRALHDHAVRRARARGRRQLLAPADEPLDTAPDRPSFAAALGARPSMVTTHARLELTAPGPADDHAELLAAAWQHARDYRLVQWGTTVPADLLADAAALEGTLGADARLGAADAEPQPPDTARIRDFERMRLARGRRAYQTGLQDPARGRLVAWSVLSLTQGQPAAALQAITVVHPAHRGRRLGVVAKLENLRHCREREPDLRAVDTWVADGNPHMRRINRELGYQPRDRRVVWQRDL